MKKIINIVFTFLVFIAGKAIAQKATVHIIAPGYNAAVYVFDPAVNYDPKKFLSDIKLDKNGAATFSADFSDPQYAEKKIVPNIRLNKNVAGVNSADLAGPRYVELWFQDLLYILFLSPGDDL